MNKLLKVESHTSLVRDVSSNAIINTSESEYESFKRRREVAQRQKVQIESQVKEIESIKCEIGEIKTLLLRLLSQEK